MNTVNEEQLLKAAESSLRCLLANTLIESEEYFAAALLPLKDTVVTDELSYDLAQGRRETQIRVLDLMHENFEVFRSHAHGAACVSRAIVIRAHVRFMSRSLRHS